LGKTKQEIWEKYAGYKEEHGSLLCWMRQLGYEVSPEKKRTTFVSLMYLIKWAKILHLKILKHNPLKFNSCRKVFQNWNPG
jgi:hypothetical protein